MKQQVSTTTLRRAAVAFALIAVVSGVLQCLAFAATGGTRHLVVGVFACLVGASVLIAVVRAMRREPAAEESPGNGR